MYWRKYAVSSLPLADAKAFDVWVNDRWKEKEKLLEQFKDTGRFPADYGSTAAGDSPESGYINTEVQLQNWYEVGHIFICAATLALVTNVVIKLYRIFS